MLCVKWEMKANDTAGRLCVDIGDPDNNLVDVEKTFERDEEEVVGRIICRSGDCGRVAGW